MINLPTKSLSQKNMTWQIDFSKDSLKFIEKNNINEENIIKALKKFIDRLKGEVINLDVKKMKGKWEGFYRRVEAAQRS